MDILSWAEMVEARDHGRGFFIQSVQLPVAVAWEPMGEKNCGQGRALSARRACGRR
jgi:hypothetical protein